MKRRTESVRIDELEPRRMLIFFGTEQADIIDLTFIDGRVHVIVNGVDNGPTIGQIDVRALGGSDLIRVTTATPENQRISINAGDGDDVLSNTNGILDDAWGGGTVTPDRCSFIGGNGIDMFIGDNSADPMSADMFITGQSISRRVNQGSQLASPEFIDEIERVQYIDSGFGNTIDVFSGIDQITVSGAGGDDTIRDYIDNPVSMVIVGGSGNDKILTDGSINSSGRELTVSSVSYQKEIDQSANYSGIEALELITTDFGDDVLILSKPSAASFSLNTGGGDDTVRFGGGDLDSNGLLNAGVTLLGGAGNDNVIFEDHVDRHSAGETESYTFGNVSLAKGAQTLLYSAFERQTLLAADGLISGQLQTVPVVNLDAINGAFVSTTINGGPNRGCIVNVGVTTLNNISGVVNVSTATSLTINDAGQTFGLTSSFEINNVQVVKTSNAQIINYSDIGLITLNTRDSTTVPDVINVRSTPAGTTVVVNANAGDDGVTMGGGNIAANLLGPVTINAGPGNDRAGFSNSLDTSAETFTLNGLNLTGGPHAYSFTAAENLSVDLGPGGTNMTVNSVVGTTRVNGGTGNEVFDVGGGSLDTNIPVTTGGAASLIIDGMGGADSIRFNDLTDTGADSYHFDRPNGADLLIKRVGGIDHVVAWFGMSQATLDASAAAVSAGSFSIIQVVDIATPLRINANGGNDWVSIRDATFPVHVNTGAGGLDRLDINADADAQPVTVIMDQSDEVEQLRVFEAATLRIEQDVVIVKTRNQTPSAGPLTIVGTIDLGGAIISRIGGVGTPPPTPAFFRQLLSRGHNGGAWNGTNASGAINSSAASLSVQSDGIGSGLGSEIGLTTHGGFAIAAGDTLIRHTLNGDADLNGVTNISDFARLAANFNGSNKVWTTGDSNYDNAANISDFSSLAANFNQSIPAGLPRTSPVMQAARFSDRLIDDVLI